MRLIEYLNEYKNILIVQVNHAAKHCNSHHAPSTAAVTVEQPPLGPPSYGQRM